jgi:hypothetical protein
MTSNAILVHLYNSCATYHNRLKQLVRTFETVEIFICFTFVRNAKNWKKGSRIAKHACQ